MPTCRLAARWSTALALVCSGGADARGRRCSRAWLLLLLLLLEGLPPPAPASASGTGLGGRLLFLMSLRSSCGQVRSKRAAAGASKHLPAIADSDTAFTDQKKQSLSCPLSAGLQPFGSYSPGLRSVPLESSACLLACVSRRRSRGPAQPPLPPESIKPAFVRCVASPFVAVSAPPHEPARGSPAWMPSDPSPPSLSLSLRSLPPQLEPSPGHCPVLRRCSPRRGLAPAWKG